MATERQKLMELLEAKYPKMLLRTTEQFDGSERGIWTSGEDGLEAKDERPLFNYYAQDYNEEIYVFGVHKEIRSFLESHGWFTEWHDAGTAMLYPE